MGCWQNIPCSFGMEKVHGSANLNSFPTSAQRQAAVCCFVHESTEYRPRWFPDGTVRWKTFLKRLGDLRNSFNILTGRPTVFLPVNSLLLTRKRLE